MTLLELVKDKTVSFQFYRAGNLWYKTTDGYEFPVPIDDVGQATMLSTDKAILFMRYIRRHMERQPE